MYFKKHISLYPQIFFTILNLYYLTLTKEEIYIVSNVVLFKQ